MAKLCQLASHCTENRVLLVAQSLLRLAAQGCKAAAYSSCEITACRQILRDQMHETIVITNMAKYNSYLSAYARDCLGSQSILYGNCLQTAVQERHLLYIVLVWGDHKVIDRMLQIKLCHICSSFCYRGYCFLCKLSVTTVVLKLPPSSMQAVQSADLNRSMILFCSCTDFLSSTWRNCGPKIAKNGW